MNRRWIAAVHEPWKVLRGRTQKIDNGSSIDWQRKSCLMLRRHSVTANTVHTSFRVIREEMVKSKGSHTLPSLLSRI
jgi:hypothetical protein